MASEAIAIEAQATQLDLGSCWRNAGTDLALNPIQQATRDLGRSVYRTPSTAEWSWALWCNEQRSLNECFPCFTCRASKTEDW